VTSLNDGTGIEITSSGSNVATASTATSNVHQPASATAADGTARVQGLLQSLTTEIDVLSQNMRETAAERRNYVRDIRLMHHYNTEASLTLVDHPSLCDFWQITVPTMAFSCVSISQQYSRFLSKFPSSFTLVNANIGWRTFFSTECSPSPPSIAHTFSPAKETTWKVSRSTTRAWHWLPTPAY
jgi:hypothetical protein